MAPTSVPEFSFRSRQHFWDHLKNNRDVTANVTVIGGGIVGAGILRELGLQGIPLSFLFEKNDFASATSSASSKLIHAGIRYLELTWNALKKFHLIEAYREFKFVWEASRERKVLTRIAPELIKPKPIYFVIGKEDGRWPVSVWLGVWVYYLIQLLQGQLFSAPESAFSYHSIHKLAPDVDPKKVKAVFRFWDSETDDARLVIENIQNAHHNGCYALNYIEMIQYKKDKDVIRIRLKNKINNEELDLQTKILINATGPFIDEVIQTEKDRSEPTQKLIDRVAGSHIDVYPKLTDRSYYVTAGDGRLVFILKRNEDGLEYTRIGTTERPLKESDPTDNPNASSDEVQYLKNLIHTFFPDCRINDENSLRVDCGIRPLKYQDKKSAFQKSRDHEIIHEGNVVHVIGVKLTDYRRVSTELMQSLPWKKLHLNLTEPKRSEYNLLRSVTSPRMFIEDNIVEMARRTMIVHWDDYVRRRRGLGPRVLSKINPEAYQREFESLSEVMEWDKNTQNQEKSRLSS